MRTPILIAILLLIFCAPTLPQEPTIRANVRLVEINVIAQDHKGEPIPDLTRDDFVIKENGKVRPITVFLLDSHQSPPTPAPALPPNTFTNKPSQQTSAVTIFLLDGLNTPFEEQANARRQLIQHLREVEPRDRIALFSLGRDLRLVHDFTSDTSLLLAALNRHKDRINTEVADSEPEDAHTSDPEMDAFLNAANEQLAAYTDATRAQGTASALRAIAAHVSSIRGRKNLVWISAGFPISTGPTMSQRSYTDELSRASRALNDADIAVYPVDAGGLRAPMASMSNSPANLPNNRRPPQLSPADLKFATMGTLADDTGGRVFHNINDLATAIRTATADARISYTLAFSPPSEVMDGKYHELKVEVKRPGIRLRYRKGYVALADVKPMTLAEALASPVSHAGIGLTAQMRPAQNGGAEMALTIDSSHLTLTQQDGKWTGQLELLLVQQQAGQDERAATRSPVTLNLNLTPEDYAKVRQSGLVTSTKVALSPGATVHIGVRDVPSGEIGTLHVHRKP